MPLTPEQKQELETTIRAFVGRPIGPPRAGRDAVNEPMIRQWCEVMDDRNPVYWDAAAAKNSVHGGIVAPPTMLGAWTMQGWEMRIGYDEPRNEEHRLHKVLTDAGYTGVLGTDTEQGFTRYLRPGDEVTVHTVIADISEEKATGAGVGYFITTRTTFTDQNGKEVGFETFRVLKFIPSQPRAGRERERGRGAAAEARPHQAAHGPRQRVVVGGGREGKDPDPALQELQEAAPSAAPDVRRVRLDGVGPHRGERPRHAAHASRSSTTRSSPGYEFPIIAALVDLDEGTRLMSSLTGCDPKAVKIGMQVAGRDPARRGRLRAARLPAGEVGEMDFAFTEEQDAIRALAAEILGAEVTAERLKAAERDAGVDSTPRSGRSSRRRTCSASRSPRRYGGMGMGFIELCVLLEELGPRGRAGPVARDARATARCRSPSSAARRSARAWLPRVARGAAQLAAARARGRGLRRGARRPPRARAATAPASCSTARSAPCRAPAAPTCCSCPRATSAASASTSSTRRRAGVALTACVTSDGRAALRRDARRRARGRGRAARRSRRRRRRDPALAPPRALTARRRAPGRRLASARSASPPTT